MAFDPDKYLADFDPDAYLGSKPMATNAAVAQNSANKAIAGIPDMLLNAPNNLLNLGRAAVGTVATAAGRSDLAPALAQNPDYFSKLMKSLGMVRDTAEPATAGQRILDTAVQSGVGMAINPSASMRQLGGSMVTGVLGGTAAGSTKEATGSDTAANIVGMLSPAAISGAASYGKGRLNSVDAENSRNAVRNATLKDARAEGYVVAPSLVNPSFINNRLESMAGKAALKQEASKRNDSVTQRIGNREAGIAEDAALTPGILDSRRDVLAQPYREVAALPGLPAPLIVKNANTQYPIKYHGATPPTPAADLEALKQARFDANRLWRDYSKSGEQATRTAALKASADVNALDASLEAAALRSGDKHLMERLREARTQIAKTHDVEKALNLGDASISAPSLGRMYDAGAPFTGGLETVAKFAQGPGRQFVTEGNRVPAPGVSGTEALAMTGFGAAGGAVGGPVGGVLAGGLPLLRGPVRSLLLSPQWQNWMADPVKHASLINRSLAKLPANSPDRQAIQAVLMERTMQDQQGILSEQ